jgi:molybdenum cofactor cytidylyltransferase
MKRVAVAVLAAGGSSRMGRPKQLLPFGGRSLLRHAAEVAVAAECGPVVVVLGAGADRLRQELDGLPVEVIVNSEWELGPGTSIRAAVETIEPNTEVDAVVFLACDQPLVDAAHIRRLIAAREVTGLPTAASGYAGTLGVPALFARELFADLRALHPAAGAKQLLARQSDAVAVVPFPDGAIDLDTPEDYQRWVQEVESRQVGKS